MIQSLVLIPGASKFFPPFESPLSNFTEGSPFHLGILTTFNRMSCFSYRYSPQVWGFKVDMSLVTNCTSIVLVTKGGRRTRKVDSFKRDKAIHRGSRYFYILSSKWRQEGSTRVSASSKVVFRVCSSLCLLGRGDTWQT